MMSSSDLETAGLLLTKDSSVTAVYPNFVKNMKIGVTCTLEDKKTEYRGGHVAKSAGKAS